MSQLAILKKENDEVHKMKSHKRIKIKMQNLSKEFTSKKKGIVAFENVNLEIGEGEFWCFVGPSGCGKTTLLRVLAGLENPTAGVLEILHQDQTKPLNSMVFQEHAIFPWMSVWDNIAYGLKNRKVPEKIIKQVVDEYIQKTGLEKFSRIFPHQLSGGMKQRVSIARAFANDPEILLMDEPFASLDEQNRLILQQGLLKIWESNRKTVVFVTHSIDEAIFLSDYIMLMTAHPGNVKNIFEINISRPRTMTDIRTKPSFSILFSKIWTELREEVKR
jgi:NitT/TauT family transport system ATP-binding protein